MLAFYGPAVLALILQHLAVTLVALSLVRERTSGVIELFRVAPVNAWEVMAGKVFSYLLIGGGDRGRRRSACSSASSTSRCSATRSALAATIGLLLLASLGLGLLIAVVSDSERQAVQLSLLTAARGGLLQRVRDRHLGIQRAGPRCSPTSCRPPTASGSRRTSCCAATASQPWEFVALGAIAAVSLLVAWRGLRRGMTGVAVDQPPASRARPRMMGARAPVAQWIERWVPDPKVAGSSPVGRAIATFSGSASANPWA